MTTAFVLGNGVSRQGIDLSVLQRHGKIYGCNALYKDFEPDVLIATDRPIAEHIQQLGYAQRKKFYTRYPISGMGAYRIPEKYWGYSSGPAALAIAALDRHATIYLLGFDMGPTQQNKFNNVYAGSQFYKAVGAHPTFTGNWTKQVAQVAADFPTLCFVRIQGATTAAVPDFSTIKNFKHRPLQELLDQLNNG